MISALLSPLLAIIHRARARAAAKSLKLVSRSTIASGLAVYCVIRNEMHQLPQFLAHYRNLGFSRFTIVDNDSTDGGADYLKTQPDVTLYHTKASFRKAWAGCFWRDALVAREGLNRWVCIVDADEYLVFPKSMGKTVQDVIAHLERAGQSRLLAPMLDLYCTGDGKTEYFDASPEILHKTSRGCEVFGGIRMRLARQDNPVQNGPVLTKYPLIYYDRQTFFTEPHFPYPRGRNNGLILARLLHRKMTGWTLKRIETSIAEGQHWKKSIEYQKYKRWITRSLQSDVTTPYTGPEDLVAAGLIETVPKTKPVSAEPGKRLVIQTG